MTLSKVRYLYDLACLGDLSCKIKSGRFFGAARFLAVMKFSIHYHRIRNN